VGEFHKATMHEEETREKSSTGLAVDRVDNFSEIEYVLASCMRHNRLRTMGEKGEKTKKLRTKVMQCKENRMPRNDQSKERKKGIGREKKSWIELDTKKMMQGSYNDENKHWISYYLRRRPISTIRFKGWTRHRLLLSSASRVSRSSVATA